MAELEGKIRAIRRRLTWFLFAELATRTVLAALILATAYLLVERLLAVPVEPLLVAASLLGVALVAATVWARMRRVNEFHAAVAADASLGLQERLSSALLLKNFHDSAGAVDALEADAIRHARAIDPARDFRFRSPKLARHLVWPVLAFAVVYLAMPQMNLLAKTQTDAPPAETPVQAQAKEKMRQTEARKLRELAKEAKKAADETKVAEGALFAKELERLSDDLYMGTKDSKTVAAELSRMEDNLKLQKNDIARKTEPFKQIGGLKRAEKTRSMQQSLKDQNFDSAASQMMQMAQQQLGEMDAQQTKQLAEEMKNLSEELKENPQMAQSLQQAAQALEQLAEQKQQQEQQQQAQAEQQQQQGAGQQQGGEQGNPQQQGGQQGQQQQGQQQAQSGQQPGQQQSGQQPQQQGGQQGQSQQQQQAGAAAMQQAQQAMQNAAQQMQSQQELMQQMAQLDQLAQQMSQQQSSMLNQQSQQQAGQQSQSKGGQQGQQNSGQQGQSGQQQQGQQGGEGQGQQQQGQQDGGTSPGGQQGQGQQAGGQQPGGQQGQQGGQGNQPGQGQGQGQGGQGQNNQPSSNQGQWSEGQPQGQSGGSGSAGRGNGGQPPDAGLVETTFVDEMIKGEKNEGEILAVIEIDAPAVKGESSVRYREQYSKQAQKAADSMKQTEIPLGYRNKVRDYFEAINPEKRAPQQ